MEFVYIYGGVVFVVVEFFCGGEDVFVGVVFGYI